MRRRPPILKEIAESLGISVSTVYAAIQNRKDISEATRRRVQEKVREMNYRPDLVARSLVTHETRVIGLVVPELSGSFFVEVLKGIEAAATRAGFQVMLCATAEDAEQEDREVETFLSKHVDGLILASAHAPGDLNVAGRLANSGTPFVLLDRRLPGGHFVGGDDIQVGYLATRHLIEEGYQRIAHLQGPNVSTANDRYSGYLKALREARIKARTEYVAPVLYHEEISAARAMDALLRLSPPPDAVFAASDPIAIGALEAARARGVRVPDELGIVGVGNHRYTPFLRVPLSTVDQNRVRIGTEAVELLLAGMREHSEPAARLIAPRLVVRDSSRRKTRGEAGELVESGAIPEPGT